MADARPASASSVGSAGSDASRPGSGYGADETKLLIGDNVDSAASETPEARAAREKHEAEMKVQAGWAAGAREA